MNRLSIHKPDDESTEKQIHHHHHHDDDEDVEDLPCLGPVAILDRNMTGETTIAPGFDSVRIDIDGRMESDLSWHEAEKQADIAIKSGIKIFWNLDLGLFDRLKSPYSNQQQYHALAISVKHFRDKIWNRFKDHSIGLCIYRGDVDFSKQFRWDEQNIENLRQWITESFDSSESFSNEIGFELSDFSDLTPQLLLMSEEGRRILALFCRDACAEYLDMVAEGTPDSLPLFLMMDAAAVTNPYLIAEMISNDCFSRFQIALKTPFQGPYFLGGSLSWEGRPFGIGLIGGEFSAKPSSVDRPRLGICLPDPRHRRPGIIDSLRQKVRMLVASNTPFRIIPEAYLIAEWDELDQLIVANETIDRDLFRKLQGFRAAGGEVI